MRTIDTTKVLLAVAVLALAAGVVMLANGCGGTDAAIKSPIAATSTPKVTTGDNAKVDVTVSQLTDVVNKLQQEVNALRMRFEVNGNMNQQVSQFDLSAQQSALIVKLSGMIVCVLVGLLLIALAAPAPADAKVCTVMLLVGVAMTVAPLLMFLGSSGGADVPSWWVYMTKALPYIVGIIAVVTFKDWLETAAKWIWGAVTRKATNPGAQE